MTTAQQKPRLLPSSSESEQALLGACFLNPKIIPQVRAQMQASDFYSQPYGLVYEALCNLGSAVDPLAVAEWLASKGVLDQCGGTLAVMELGECVPTSAGWAYHVNVIKEKALRRDIIKACSKAGTAAYGIDDPTEILSDLKERVRELNAIEPKRNNADLVMAVWNDIERRQESGQRYVGAKTGFKVIDDRIYGLEPKTTIYLIARPSIGKTALALNIAERVPGNVVFFSLESNAEALTRRRLASESGVPLWRIRTANLDDDQFSELRGAASAVSETNLAVLDNPKFKLIENLTAQCESMAMDGPISLVVVDHIQRMRSLKRLQNRHLELSWISEELSTLAKNLNVPIMILCQLNREVEKRPAKSKYPQLFDIRESGDLEQNADQVWGLWRSDKESPDCRLECLKGRDTGTWLAWLRFDMDIQRFYDSKETQTTDDVKDWRD